MQEVSARGRCEGVLRGPSARVHSSPPTHTHAFTSPSPPFRSMAVGQVPALWKGSVSFPSLKPLASYVVDLLARLSMLHTWYAGEGGEGLPSSRCPGAWYWRVTRALWGLGPWGLSARVLGHWSVLSTLYPSPLHAPPPPPIGTRRAPRRCSGSAASSSRPPSRRRRCRTTRASTSCPSTR